MNISQRIKLLREEQNLTQEDLAKMLKLSKQTVSNYETEARKPGIKLVMKCADVFGVSVDYLLGRTEGGVRDIAYQSAKLADIIAYYAKDFKPKNGVVRDFDYWVDMQKQEVVFRLMLEK